MKRVQKNLITAVILLGAGLGIGIYTLKTKVKDRDTRIREEQNNLRLFKDKFGLIDVERGVLLARTTTITFARSANGWQIESPVSWPGDTTTLEAAVQRMLSVKTEEESLNENPTKEHFRRAGLIKPKVRLTLETKKGKYTLLVGDKNQIRNRYPVTDGDKKKIGLAPDTFYWSFDRSLEDFRSKRVFPFTPAEIAAVTRSSGGKTKFSLKLAEGTWSLVGDAEGTTLEADDAVVNRLLVAMTKRLKIDRFVTDAYDAAQHAAKYGLETPLFTLSVEGKNGTKVVADFGKYEETAAEEGTLVAQLRGTTTLVAVPNWINESTDKKPADLQDRTISRFKYKAVARLELHHANKPTCVLVKKDDDWLLEAPTAGPAKIWKVDNINRVFSVLKAKRFYAPNAKPQQLSQWQLEPASRRLIFKDDAGQLLADIRIGKRATEDEIFAMATGSKRVDVITEAPVSIIPERCDAFKEDR